MEVNYSKTIQERRILKKKKNLFYIKGDNFVLEFLNWYLWLFLLDKKILFFKPCKPSIPFFGT